MSKIAELADRVITLVAEETDTPREAILSKSRAAEAVDARHLAIKLLHSKNIYPSRIAAIFGISPRSVRHVITAFDARAQTNDAMEDSRKDREIATLTAQLTAANSRAERQTELAPIYQQLSEIACNQPPVKKICCPEQYVPVNTGINAMYGLIPTGCGNVFAGAFNPFGGFGNGTGSFF